MNWINILILIGVVSVDAFIMYKEKQRLNKKIQLKDLREKLFMLFLYAEKQDWINEEKWEWCVKEAHIKLPSVIYKVISESTIEEWMIKAYQEFKVYLMDEKQLTE